MFQHTEAEFTCQKSDVFRRTLDRAVINLPGFQTASTWLTLVLLAITDVLLNWGEQYLQLTWLWCLASLHLPQKMHSVQIFQILAPFQNVSQTFYFALFSY